MSELPSNSIGYDLLIARLCDVREALSTRVPLPPGVLVRWKRGLQQSNLLDANGLAVVVRPHATPVVADDVDVQANEMGLPLDVEVGTLDAEGTFFVFWTCSNFLESADADGGCQARLLRATYAEFATDVPLAVGQVAVWKPHCAPSGLPADGMPVVVTELLESPARTPAGSWERDFRQPVDLAVAVEDALCAFRTVWSDRRRLAPYAGPVANLEEAASRDVADPGDSGNGGAPAVAARLLQRQASLAASHPLPVGTLVRWKPGMRDRTVPLESDAAIVVGSVASPLQDPTAAVGSPLWRQPLSVALGCMGEDGHFVVCHYDARRFEPLSGEETEHREFLQRSAALYRASHAFRPGDLLEWKPGLVNRKSPLDGGLAIVLQTLDPPIISGLIEGSSPYFQEPLSLVVGVREEDVFMALHVDGARLQPATEGAASEEGRWLRARRNEYLEPTPVAPGALVEWKEGQCVFPQFGPDDHGIVLEVFDPPLIATGHSAGSAAFGVEHSAAVGFLDEEDVLRTRYVDARRLRPATSSADEDLRLMELYGELSTPREFTAGQGVFWIPGLQGEAFLELTVDSPGIVLGRLTPPVVSPQTNLMSDEYGLRADLLVGGFDVDGDFAVAHADSRRLTLHPSQHGDAVRRLRGFRRRLRHDTAVRPGMLVAWKDRFCAQTALPSGLPGIVLDVSDTVQLARNPSVPLGSPAFVTPWNTVVGVWSDTRLIRVHCDSHRLEPFDATAQGEILQRRTKEEARRMEDFSRMLEEFDGEDPPF